MMQSLSSALTTYLGNFDMLLDDLIECGDTESEMFGSVEPTIAII